MIGADVLEVRSPHSGELIRTIPAAGPADVERALAAAVEGAGEMAAGAAHERAAILHRAAALIERDAADLARTITAEQGKHTGEAAAEAGRIAGIVRLCAEEATRLGGEVLPMDAAPVSTGCLGYTRPEPTGPVLAITPFNYPAILVIHKIGPALAAGNPVILKPAAATPLTALFLVERLLEAGIPPLALHCVVGSGAVLGPLLCRDPRIRKISFTGSHAAGEAIARAAGVKRLTCELGSSAALVVLEDADVERAAGAIARSGYTNAGQNCVSTQRVLVHRSLRAELVDRVAELATSLRPGDPADPETTLSPVISSAEGARVVSWLREACTAGAELLVGGGADGATVEPAIVVDPPADARVWRDELFGPAVAIRAFDRDAEALELANASRYGLALSVMTRDVDRALRFAHGLRAGIVNVNSPYGATWRADFMPWGGFGDSGFGKEGVRSAIRDMTEDKLVVIHPSGRS